MKQHQTGWRHWLKGFMFRHMPAMISCREFENFVIDYLDGELNSRQQQRFESHLRMCRECREYLQAYKRAIDIDRAVCTMDDEAVPENVPEELIKAILEARKNN